MTIKVLVVDDSALVRSLLAEIIRETPDMTLVGAAPDAYVARDMVNEFAPDVITLDIEMPRMDGLAFLEKLMKARPTPVVMISTLTEAGAEATLHALELGAVDFVSKPKIDIAAGLKEYGSEIANKIRIAKSARLKQNASPSVTKSATADVVLPSVSNRIASTEKLIIVGASTGGTEAIKEFLIRMPPDSPGILVTQHMPEGFTRSFANRLNSLCKISVVEAQGGERVLPGHAYIAPGHSHLLL